MFEHQLARRLILSVERVQAHRAAVQLEFLEEFAGDGDFVGLRIHERAAGQMSAPGGRAFHLTWQQALDLRNLLAASEWICRSTLLREESRGAHYREDFPSTDHANWLKNIYLARNGDGLRLWTEAVKLTRLKP